MKYGTTVKAWLQSFISAPLPSPPDRGELLSHPQGSCVPKFQTWLILTASMSTNLVDWSWRAFCTIRKIVANYLSVKKLPVQSTTESLIIDTHWGWYFFSVLLHRSLFKHLSRIQELVFERDVETRTFTLFKLLWVTLGRWAAKQTIPHKLWEEKVG